jgi:hypothetical protein
MSNLEIFWDQVLIDNHPEAASRSTEVPLTFATEHFRGYPKQLEGPSPGDLNYDYDRVSLTGPFQHQRGTYTRMGDVTALVKGIDDRYAIFGLRCPPTGPATSSSTPTALSKTWTGGMPRPSPWRSCPSIA